MYTVTTTTGPATEPITKAEVKLYLRTNNSTSEDDLIDEMITAARIIFETRTNQALIAQTLRQHCQYVPSILRLMRTPVTSITAVKYYDTSDTLQTLSPSDYETNLTGPVAMVFLDAVPQLSHTKTYPLYIDFVGGYSTVPKPITVAIKGLVAHLYQYREAYREKSLTSLPLAFEAACDHYRLGLSGHWGM